jgi:outer membrane protein assembly factor BamB
VYCLELTTGRVVWQSRVSRPIWCSPCVVDDKVVFGSYDHNLYLLDAGTGREIYRHDMGGRVISTPCIVDGFIYVGTATGRFFCLGPP